jgi:Leu/Phe-tRNA-protein transferase
VGHEIFSALAEGTKFALVNLKERLLSMAITVATAQVVGAHLFEFGFVGEELVEREKKAIEDAKAAKEAASLADAAAKEALEAKKITEEELAAARAYSDERRKIYDL